MAQILFVPNPHVRLDRSWAAPYVPIELLSAMAVAEQAGAEPALFDVNRLVEHRMLAVGRGIWSQAAALLAEAEPDLVVMETWSGTLHNTLLLADAIRRALPALPVVLTGAGTSACAVAVLERFAAIDGVIRGEPEPAMEVLARRPTRPLPEAPGLARHLTATAATAATAASNDHATILDAAPTWVEDVDALPRPALHLALLQPGDAIPVEAGRGCPQGCTFCPLAGQWSRRYRPRSVAHLADEMIALGRERPGALLDLTPDPVFFTDRDRMIDLCTRLRGRGVRFCCDARPDRITVDDVDRLAAAGCVGLRMGIESGCPEVQQSIGKAIDLRSVDPIITQAVRRGIEVQASFILGLPGEDSAALARTARAVIRARRAGATTQVQILRAYPGSAVHEAHAAHLAPEPLLATAAPDDGEARAIIAAHPALLPASYRVPGEVAAPRVLGAWIALGPLAPVVDALARHGIDVARAIADGALVLEANGDADMDAMDLRSTDGSGSTKSIESIESVESIESGARRIGHRIEALVADDPFIDRVTLHDLITYHVAALSLAREPVDDTPPADERALTRIAAAPDRWTAFVRSPWRLISLRTDLAALHEGRLTPRPHDQAQQILVARVPVDGAPRFYTRRAAATQGFVIDDAAAAIVRYADGTRDLATIAEALLTDGIVPAGEARTAVIEVVTDLARGGVLTIAACDG